MNETVFWRPDGTTARASCAPGACRTSRTVCPSSRMSSSTRRASTTICSSRCAAHRAGSNPTTASNSTGLTVADSGEYPVTVTLRGTDCPAGGRARSRCAPGTSWAATVRAASCASRSVRELRGDAANHAWGVMDILAVTDFPDIRIKAAIQSGNERQHRAHPSRGRLPRAALCRSRRGRPRRSSRRAQHVSPTRSSRPPGACSTRTRSTSRRSPGSRSTRSANGSPTIRRRAGRARRHPLAACVHRRRRLPHAQRQGGPGHERVDAGRLQPRLEARRGARGPQPRVAAAHLLGRAPARSPKS